MPTDYSPIFQAAAQSWNVDPALLRAVSQVESGGNPQAVSGAGAQGLMQIMPNTAKSLGVDDPNDPTQAIFGAAKLLSQNIDRYGNVPDALRAYNAGTDQNNWGNAETIAYVPKVAQAYQKIKLASAPVGGDPFSAALSVASVGDSGTQNPAASSREQSDPFSLALSAANSDHGDDVQPQQQSGIAATAARVGVGAIRGVSDIGDTIARGIDNFSQYVDDRVPFLNRLEQAAASYGLSPTPAQNLAALDEGRAAYDQKYGNDLAANIGRIGGQAAVTLPLMGGANRLLAAGAEAAAPGLAGAVANFANTNLLTRIAAGALGGAGQGAEAAALASGQSNAPIGQQIEQGASFGGALGGAAPILSKTIGGATSALLGIGGDVSPLDASLAQRAKQFGIDVRGGQISNSPGVKTLDSVLPHIPGSGYASANDQQISQFTRAVSRTFGENTETLTPDVMQQARSRIGRIMDAIAQRTPIKADNQFVNDLAQIEHDAPQVLTDSEFAPIRKQLDNLIDKIGPNNEISGAAYQALTRKNSPLDVAMSSRDSNISNVAAQIRDALDDAFQRSATPEDKQALSAARLQYKNLMTVAPLVAKGLPGEISPAALQGRVVANFKNAAFQGAGDLGDLAAIGQRFLKPVANSGTPQRLTALEALKTAGGAAGGLLGIGAAAGAAGAIPAAGSALGTIAAARAAGAYLRSPAYVNRLIASGLGTAVRPPAINRLIEAGVPLAAPLGAIELNRQ